MTVSLTPPLNVLRSWRCSKWNQIQKLNKETIEDMKIIHAKPEMELLLKTYTHDLTTSSPMEIAIQVRKEIEEMMGADMHTSISKHCKVLWNHQTDQALMCPHFQMTTYNKRNYFYFYFFILQLWIPKISKKNIPKSSKIFENHPKSSKKLSKIFQENFRNLTIPRITKKKSKIFQKPSKIFQTLGFKLCFSRFPRFPKSTIFQENLPKSSKISKISKNILENRGSWKILESQNECR